jgi:hypothetical protein
MTGKRCRDGYESLSIKLSSKEFDVFLHLPIAIAAMLSLPVSLNRRRFVLVAPERPKECYWHAINSKGILFLSQVEPIAETRNLRGNAG